MISPPLATADATSAISSGVACVLPWPKPPMASSGMLFTKSATVPKTDRAGRGRSNGGAWLKPMRSDVATMSGAPTVTAISAKAVLQLRRNTSTKVPPQVVPS